MGIFDFFNKKESLEKGLQKTKQSFLGNLTRIIVGKTKVDDDVLDALEETLIGADVGVETTIRIIERIQERAAKERYISSNELNGILKEEIAALLEENNNKDLEDFTIPKLNTPFVILVVGVNGVGKTTTIGKLAAQYHQRGKKVVLGAGDTFRAAAVDQLKLWGDRIGVPVVDHGMNTDPASVAFDAVKTAVEMKADVVIIDTAGRLHTKINLMTELAKIKKVIQRFIPDAPHEVLLVLDGSTGQNAFIQASEFTKATDVTALAITKLDGTAKGGVVIGISDQFKIPVKYIGVGEQVNDLQVFNRKDFVESLFDDK